jgi:hypothetical protein
VIEDFRVPRLRKWQKHNLQRLTTLRGKFRGKQCVVLCSGPSLHQTDLTLLDGHPHVLGVNGTYLVRNRYLFYFCSNVDYVTANVERIAHVEAEYFFFRAEVFKYCRRAGIDESRMLLFQGANSEVSTEISVDLTRFLPWGPTVLLSIVLPAVLWAGFQEILLVGADFPLSDYRRFYTGESRVPTQVKRRASDYDVEMEIAHFRASLWARHIVEHHPGTRILNCSAFSELQAFERADLRQMVRQS